MPSGMYALFALPYYWKHVHYMLPLTVCFFFFLTVGCLLAACCSDPGIIPRRDVINATGTAELIEAELGYNVLGEHCDDLQVPMRMQIPTELRNIGYRWCTTCKIVKPPRASHCSDCDNCVLRLDHHCPFINNCVGQRNYMYFVGFTSSVCVLALLVIPSLMWLLFSGQVAEEDRRNQLAPGMESSMLFAVLITLAVAGGVAGLCVFGLWLYHIFLICTGKTTKEHLKGRRPPFGLGDDLTLCGRRGPRLFNPRAWVRAVTDDLSGGTWKFQDMESVRVVEG